MKTLLISHKPDPDGVTPIILLKIILDEFDYLLLNNSDKEIAVKELLDNNVFDEYDQIYITDLGIGAENYEKIENNSNLSNKVKLFDHHGSNLFANDYSFAKVIVEDELGNKQSATSLFYEHLLKTYDNEILKKDVVKHFVELVRQYDTWEWFTKYNNKDAAKLTNLFDIFGSEYFINYYYKIFMTEEKFSFSPKEEYLLEIESSRIRQAKEEAERKIIPITLINHKVAVLFVDKYASYIGSELSRKYIDTYDFFILIDVGSGISYRGADKVNLGEIAKVFGGGGHPNASGSSITEEIQNELLKSIFGDKIKLEERLPKESALKKIKSIK